MLPCTLFSQIQFNSAVIAGGPQDDIARKIKMDLDGNFLVLGTFTGPATFGTNTIQGAGFTDCYLQKLDSNGEIVWTISVGGPSTDLALAIAIDESNNIWISGKFSGTIDLDPSPNVINIASAPSNGFDCFLACYNGQTGEYITHKDITSGGILEIRAIEFTKNQQVIIGGTFQFTVDFDFSSGTLFKTSFVNSFDGFVANYSADFETNNWVNILNSNNPALDYVNDVEILNNKIYLTGLVAGTMDIAPGNNTVEIFGATDAFLIAYNVNNGNLNWGFKIGGNSLEIGNFVSVINNKVYLSGTVNSNNVDFNPGNADNFISANGLNSPPFIAKYDTLGNYIAAYLFDMAENSTYTISAIKPAENNEVLVSGYFKGEIDIDLSVETLNLSSNNVNNSFFLLLSDDDNLLDYKFIESATENTLNDIAYSQGKVYVIGGFDVSCSPDQTLNTTVNSLFSNNSDAYIFNYAPIVTSNNKLLTRESHLFPNPVNEHSILTYIENTSFDVIDISGKIYGTLISNCPNKLFETLPKGIYFAVNSKNQHYIKFIKVD
jgi:hypothetical protein